MEFWNKCSEKLENKLSQEDFNTWIRPLKGNLNKNTLEIVAPNDFILNYVETNLSDEIMEMIKSQSKKDISLVFKTLTKETFVDKYSNNKKSEDTKLVPSYVFDTFVEDMPKGFFKDRPWDVGNNPKTAVWKYLKQHPEFIIDKSIQDKLLVTVAPDGFLKRVD